jgi:site-specific DNA-cytosine methylase
LQLFLSIISAAGQGLNKYLQVGNAIPPLLARHVAAIVAQVLAGEQVMATITTRGWVKPAEGAC